MRIEPVPVKSVYPCSFVQSPQVFHKIWENLGVYFVSFTSHFIHCNCEDAVMRDTNVTHLKKKKITTSEGARDFFTFCVKAGVDAPHATSWRNMVKLKSSDTFPYFQR